MSPNQYLLAADNHPDLLPLLRATPALASEQDEHGYSLVHAAASYGHLDLLRTLIQELKVDVDLRDEDGETALFVVETTEAAKVLVEELGANPNHQGAEGLTARQKIEAEGDFPAVAAYLTSVEAPEDPAATAAAVMPEVIPPPPEGMSVTVGTMDESQDVPQEIDSAFRRRIEELAQRDDFEMPTGQAELRRLVEDAVSGEALGEERSVRSKQA
ncbi:ankyrin repeats (many copies) domain-containing protein [Sarocladium implicatum]|nr:ankyrin repeats (many copies) domain-containing protein [Sarocladium implicatum]